MEVHHHPNLHHEKKPWKEYLLEGLMIFLAVTMGFFAESLREYISNKEKGHEFVVSLMADLKSDTAKMNDYLADNDEQIADYKLILNWMDGPARNDDTAFRSRFYKEASYTLGMSSVNFTNRIISQLKNSDNFRLIVNHQVADAITDYSNGTNACDKQADVVAHYTEECSKPASEMINFKAYKNKLDNGKKAADNTILFRSTDPKVVQDYANAIYLKAGVERAYTRMVKEQQQRALKLIELLKKEYDLE